MKIANQHPDAIDVTGRYHANKDGTLEYEIVVTTDLPLHVLAPGHDKAKVDSLLAWAQELLARDGMANRVVVTQRSVS